MTRCHCPHSPVADQPTDVSTMAHYKDGGYEDVLEERRHTSDLKYAMKTRPDVPRYKYCKPRTPTQLKEQVLHSDRLRYTIEKVSVVFFIIACVYIGVNVVFEYIIQFVSTTKLIPF